VRTQNYNAMKGIISIFLTVFLSVFLLSCAASMTPMQVNNTLPKLTKSALLTSEQTKSPQCKCLETGRTYVAPIGLTTKADLKNAAVGIDEWVTIDGGNAYKLVNFRWVTAASDQNGTPTRTQLIVDFDTYFCQ